MKKSFPAGTALYGTGTSGCSGTLAMGANTIPNVDTPNFAMTCTNAPRNSLGQGVITDSPDFAGTDFGFGIKFHVDLLLSTEIIGYDINSDSSGIAFTPASIPNNPSVAGQTFYAQSFWIERAADGQYCSYAPMALVSSNGISLTIQP
ncbi:MAG: hypothetical protein ACKVS6_14935 [Planctomycetota bacterium]